MSTGEVFDRPPLPAELAAAVRTNVLYRHVLFTDPPEKEGQRMQIVAMALGMLPSSIDSATDLGMEMHDDTTQYFAVISGEGTVTTGPTRDDVTSQPISLKRESKWEVGSKQWHNVSVKPGKSLQLLTIYHPPHHPPGTIDVTKEAAERRMSAQ